MLAAQVYKLKPSKSQVAMMSHWLVALGEPDMPSFLTAPLGARVHFAHQP